MIFFHTLFNTYDSLIFFFFRNNQIISFNSVSRVHSVLNRVLFFLLAKRPPVEETANFLQALLQNHGPNYLEKLFGTKARNALDPLGGVQKVAVALSGTSTKASFAIHLLIYFVYLLNTNVWFVFLTSSARLYVNVNMQMRDTRNKFTTPENYRLKVYSFTDCSCSLQKCFFTV